MSQSTQSSGWFQSNYEKIVLLAALLALLFSCVWLALSMTRKSEEMDLLVSRLNENGDAVVKGTTTGFDERLSAARGAAEQAAEGLERVFMSEQRVSCVKCHRPIPYDAMTCPFPMCNEAQPEIVNEDELDSDGDGIPDKMEIQLGLNPQDPGDGDGDLDGDGFSNAEEIAFGTDPKDPDSCPDPVVKLRVEKIKAIPFYLRFLSVSEFAGGVQKFQLNLQSAQKTYFVQLKDIVEGYQVVGYDAAAAAGPTLRLKRVADGRAVTLVRGRPVTENELAIRFVFLIDRTALPIRRLNDTFELRGKTYKVIDIKPESVIIQDINTTRQITVPMLSQQERSAASAPVQAAPATDSIW